MNLKDGDIQRLTLEVVDKNRTIAMLQGFKKKATILEKGVKDAICSMEITRSMEKTNYVDGEIDFLNDLLAEAAK